MIKTIIGFSYLIFSMILLLPFAFIALIFYMLGLRKLTIMLIYRFAQGWALSIIPIIGCKAAVKGKENIPRKEGVCFVSNHTGYFDVAMMLAYCGRPFGFIAKKEFSYVPFLNIWIYLLGGLFIDRKNVRKAVRTIEKGVKRIKSGGGIVIFPEGTRSQNGELLPFHVGSLKLATKSEAIIVPVVIDGSYKVYEEHKRVVGSEVKITFLAPIETASIPLEDRKQVLCDKIYSVIKEEITKNKNPL